MGCTSVENGDAAHNRGSVNHEPLIALTDSSGAILVAPENRCESRFDNPSGGHLYFNAAHQSEDIQHGFLFLNPGIAKIELAASHDCSQVPPAEFLRGTPTIECSKDYRGVDDVSRVRKLLARGAGHEWTLR